MVAKKILIVDDDPNILKLVKTRLEAHNYEVIAASDGEECMQKVLSDKPDLIILDILMPKADGYDVLVGMKEIKALTGKIPVIPVIVLTALSDPRVRGMIEKEEIKDYIVKPFNAEDLLNKVRQALGG
ncbi:response regulator [bacterium]|nr:MAG: response regulator [bacterium]